MHTPRVLSRLVLSGLLALVALAVPAGALAAPTATQIVEPADPAYVDLDAANPGALHVTGTTSGGTGDVDLRCFIGSDSKLVASAVPVSNGNFVVDVPLTQALGSALGYPRPYCVMRAVPTGTSPAAPPDQVSPFQGPHVGWGEDRPNTLGVAGSPVNPPGTLWDYGIERAQAKAYNDYYSAGSCGLCDTYLIDPLTLQSTNAIWWANAALYKVVPFDGGTRSEVRIDGVDVYNPGGLSGGANELKNNPGFPALTYSKSVDPATGDLTIHETDPFVACSPQPATYPPTDVTCPTFAAPAVTLDRTIVQDHDGLQVTFTDHWHSNDQKPHQLEAIYDDSNADANSDQAGHESSYDFPWSCSPGFKPYGNDVDIRPPAAGPVTLYIKSDATTPDTGDGKNAFGALTYATPPDAIHIQKTPASDHAPYGDWQTHYLRTVPASGDLVITQVYSHDFALASVKALAQEAEQALPPVAGAELQPCAVDPGPAADDSGASTATTTPSETTVEAAKVSTTSLIPPAALPAAAVKCHVPRLHGRTLRGAKRILRLAHCRLGTVTRTTRARVRPGRVVRSTPRAGTIRRAGKHIAVVVRVTA
jgi:hypothetical protein